MYQITKRFNGYPAAHRQPKHDGHCKLIHGHNWDFEVMLGTEELDDNGFVYDFGKFKELRKWLEHNFDHTLLLQKDDPKLEQIAQACPAEVVTLPSVSCEGLAKFVFEHLATEVEKESEGRVRVLCVTVYEDEHNSACYHE